MKNLESFFENPFSNSKISLEKKKKFGESHLMRLAVQNTDNMYDDILVVTTAVQTALFGEITDVELNKALQKTQTETVDNLIDRFKKRNSRLNNYLMANEVNKQPVYQSFFPQSIAEFTNKVTKGNVEQLMKRIVEVISANTAVAGGAAVLTEYQAFLTQYKSARNLQLTKIGEVSGGITDRETAEAAWDDQLFHNLLMIARENRNKPDRVNDFFDQSIIRSGSKDAAEEGPLTTGSGNGMPAALLS